MENKPEYGEKVTPLPHKELGEKVKAPKSTSVLGLIFLIIILTIPPFWFLGLVEFIGYLKNLT